MILGQDADCIPGEFKSFAHRQRVVVIIGDLISLTILLLNLLFCVSNILLV